MEPNTRVCPQCGEPAGEQPFCAACGRNLLHETQLPTRAEWEAAGSERVASKEGPVAQSSTHAPRSRRWIGWAAAGVSGLIIVAVVIVLTSGANLKTLRIPSGSMEPTFKIGESISVDSSRRRPRVGDVIVFYTPAGAEPVDAVCGNRNQGTGHSQACDQPTAGESSEIFIKRVVAGPGDTISIVDGHVVRNGVTEADSSYTYACGDGPDCNFRTPIKIPAGEYFVLGDNRGESDDSRFWGPVPRAWIIGTVVQ